MGNFGENSQCERLERYLENLSKGDEGTDSAIFQYQDNRFLEKKMNEQNVEGLRRLPAYFDQILVSEKSPVGLLCRDHYSYWAWTAAIAGAFDRQVLYMIDMGSPIPDALKDYRERVREYLTLCNSVIFPIREKGMDGRVQAFFTAMNPNVEGLSSQLMMSSAGTLGFSVLDGLLTIHLDRINAEGDLAGQSTIPAPWRDDGQASNPPNLRDKLELWKSSEATSKEVQSTLSSIDSLDENDIENLKNTPIFPNQNWNSLPEDSKRRDSFFWVLKEHRNENIHGLESPQMVGPIVMNICCLVIWDVINSKAYQGMVQTLENEVSSTSVTATTRSSNRIIGGDFGREAIMDLDGFPFWKHPTTFYPLYSDESYQTAK